MVNKPINDSTIKGKHILIYDRLWWIQGQRALLLQKYHPNLEIMSYHDFLDLVKQKGVKMVNKEYEVISTLGLWTAERLIQHNVHVYSSVAGSYSYLATNQDDFREWAEQIKPNNRYIKQVIKKIDRIGAVNKKLANTIKKYCPDKHVDYVKAFVETDKFKPLPLPQKDTSVFTIGWVGNSDKRSKNYHTVYKAIKNHYKNDSTIVFKEATKESRIDRTDMPEFYNSIDLLLVTGANEGLPNPAMEAYACGVPVLGTNIGIIKDWASPNAKSFILNSDDPRKFIYKINQLKSNPKLHQTLKKEIRKNIENNWTIKQNIDGWLYTLFNIGGER
ncbi:glycosyltransferase family 4 protein [Oceanobacillus iheyensis]|uniref:Glycosyl transferase family 1 domain-containing protein n=1 Tax=Oceanobacillus iheyensis (strain DSM 14371 / CIP 107618 / JCM 11309 / KCTC 3954 / HTE831) TaxID=221109 RepID=Q8EPK5_OCEIH|nr:glycosyltransferase [Oceanobacillus iheyensis]BAC14052.1 hypothetical protein [Oceanobacillus iheyensis HTE831]